METAIKNGTNYSMGHFGELKGLGQYLYKPKNIPGEFPGKLFLKQQLNLTGMEVSVNSMPQVLQSLFITNINKTKNFLFVLKEMENSLLTRIDFLLKKGQ